MLYAILYHTKPIIVLNAFIYIIVYNITVCNTIWYALQYYIFDYFLPFTRVNSNIHYIITYC